MSIYLNNQGLKKIKAVSANINNQLKTIKAVYTNVNGTIHKVWPYYAFDNGTFKGELAGGVINAPSNVVYYSTTRSPNGHHWNNKSSNQTITSGTLSVTSDHPFGNNFTYGPFFVSVNTIDFTSVSKIRVTGSFTAKIRADINGGLASIDMNMGLGEYTKSGSTYTKKAITATQSTSDIESKNTTESAFWYTGTVNYDFTFDVSSWKETSGILGLFVNNNWYDTGGGGGDYSTQTAQINIIEFS